MKVGQHTEKRDTTTNPTQGNPTTITKGQQPEMAEIYKYPKRHQGRSREGRRRTPTYKGSICGLTGRTDCSGTIDKAQ